MGLEQEQMSKEMRNTAFSIVMLILGLELIETRHKKVFTQLRVVQVKIEQLVPSPVQDPQGLYVTVIVRSI